MNLFRRFLLTGALTVAACGFASADSVISYSISIPSTPTAVDLVNSTNTLTAWNPGGTNAADFILSNESLTMAGLPAGAVLVWYDIHLTEVITGTITLQNTGSSSFDTDFADFNVRTHAGLGLTSLSAYNSTFDRFGTQDLFAGFDANAVGDFDVTGQAGGTTQSTAYTGSSVRDTGHLFNTSAVTAPPDPFTIFLRTFTEQASSGLGGNGASTYTDSVQAFVTITYDYFIPSSTPEPMSLILVGSGLVAVGFLRKHVRR